MKGNVFLVIFAFNFQIQRYPVFHWKRGGPNEYSLQQLLIFWCANDDSLMFLCDSHKKKIAHKNGIIAYYLTPSVKTTYSIVQLHKYNKL